MLDKQIKVGDEIYVEQAWEDQTGALHDEYAIVEAIDENGDMKLKFKRDDVNKFLEGSTFNIRDF